MGDPGRAGADTMERLRIMDSYHRAQYNLCNIKLGYSLATRNSVIEIIQMLKLLDVNLYEGQTKVKIENSCKKVPTDTVLNKRLLQILHKQTLRASGW